MNIKLRESRTYLADRSQDKGLAKAVDLFIFRFSRFSREESDKSIPLLKTGLNSLSVAKLAGA
jgi:hypothetical protein